MPLFENDHFDLLQLQNILEPKEQYSFDYTYSSIDQEIAQFEVWNTSVDGLTSNEEQVDDTPQNWYTVYWFNCAFFGQCADFNGYELRELCDYTFEDDESIYTGHPLDFY